MPGQASIRINENEWAVSLATTYAELVQGLSGVSSIPAGLGMLFVLPVDQSVSVTTQLLQFNIDIIFISSGLEVVDVARNVTPGNIVTEGTPVRYFLEVNAEEADDIESGDIVGITIYQPAGTVANWISPLVSIAGLMAVGAFMVSTVRSITRAILGEPIERLLPQTKSEGIKTIDARGMSLSELSKIDRQYPASLYRQIAVSHAHRLTTEDDIREFRKRAIEAGAIVIIIQEYGQYAYVPIGIKSRYTELPQVLIEGGESVPIQYRHLIGWISEPLPEYSLAVELLPAVEVGERKIDTVLKQLKDGVESIQQSERFRLFLTTMAKFHEYSIGNQILIMLQKPDAIKVAGFNTWKGLERWVVKGERGIAILAPVMPPRLTCPKCGTKLPKGVRFCPQCGESVDVEEEIEATPRYFKVVYVFDISQTEGKPLPEFEVPVLTGEANEELFAKVIALAKSQGLDISFESRPYQDPSVKGQYFAKSIWVRPEEPRAQQLKSLLHEVAHYYSEGVFHIPRRDAETIAESAAFAVGAHWGFDTGVRSFPYVALWAQDKKVLEQNLTAIRKVATTIIAALAETVPVSPKVIPTGTCYQDAWRYVIQRGEGTLVHGTAISLGRRLGHAWVELPDGTVWESYSKGILSIERFRSLVEPIEEARYTPTEAAIMVARVGKHGPWTAEERSKFLKEKFPAVIPTEPRPRREGDLEYLADSPEFVTQTIADIGYRGKLDTAFQEAIARAKGLR